MTRRTDRAHRLYPCRRPPAPDRRPPNFAMFKNAQGKIDGRILMGLMLGIGSGAGVAIKLWWSISDSLPPFWLWAVPVVCVMVLVGMWVARRREHAEIRERLERSGRVVRRVDTQEQAGTGAEL